MLLSIKEFSANDFRGFFKVKDMDNKYDIIPNLPGIYIVISDPLIKYPNFLSINPGGKFKGKDPTVAIQILKSNWVNNAPVLYIGKSKNLRQRIKQLVRFSNGYPVGHWGGRILWQVAGSEQFKIAWLAKPGIDPDQLEAQYLDLFKNEYGMLPFANLQESRKPKL